MCLSQAGPDNKKKRKAAACECCRVGRAGVAPVPRASMCVCVCVCACVSVCFLLCKYVRACQEADL